MMKKAGLMATHEDATSATKLGKSIRGKMDISNTNMSSEEPNLP